MTTSHDNISKFPQNFVWGTATASYQIEGAYNEDGRGMSIWDTFSRIPDKVRNGDTGDVACDHYHRLEEDIRILQDLGVKSYRFSLSWSRILTSGKLPVNQKAIEHYQKEIDLLLKAGIEPFITLYHWDLPQSLEDEYGGWTSDKIVQDFVQYADVCFQYFGDKVKTWATINEPYCVAIFGYGNGIHAPGRKSMVDPVIVGHNLLLAHAHAVHLYRTKYVHQGGKIGMALNGEFAEPLRDTDEDRAAANTYMALSWGWFGDPIFFGDYPQEMKNFIKGLPTFTDEQKQLLKGSHDFFGCNTYTSRYVSAEKPLDSMEALKVHVARNGVPIGPCAESNWLYVVPWGFRKLLSWLHQRYDTHKPGHAIYVTENGVSVPRESELPLEEALHDTFRLDYLKSHIEALRQAIVEDNVRVEKYYVWSLMDNFEWGDGYSTRFGIYYVDFKNNQQRYQKDSAKWYKDFIASQRS